jgi:hypothetical protein
MLQCLLNTMHNKYYHVAYVVYHRFKHAHGAWSCAHTDSLTLCLLLQVRLLLGTPSTSIVQTLSCHDDLRLITLLFLLIGRVAEQKPQVQCFPPLNRSEAVINYYHSVTIIELQYNLLADKDQNDSRRSIITILLQ